MEQMFFAQDIEPEAPIDEDDVEPAENGERIFTKCTQQHQELPRHPIRGLQRLLYSLNTTQILKYMCSKKDKICTWKNNENNQKGPKGKRKSIL